MVTNRKKNWFSLALMQCTIPLCLSVFYCYILNTTVLATTYRIKLGKNDQQKQINTKCIYQMKLRNINVQIMT